MNGVMYIKVYVNPIFYSLYDRLHLIGAIYKPSLKISKNWGKFFLQISFWTHFFDFFLERGIYYGVYGGEHMLGAILGLI